MIVLYTLAVILISPVIVLGLFCIYAGYRFARKTNGDKTAAGWHWLSLIWILATQTEQMAELIPAIKKDLSELYGFDDDGEVT